MANIKIFIKVNLNIYITVLNIGQRFVLKINTDITKLKRLYNSSGDRRIFFCAGARNKKFHESQFKYRYNRFKHNSALFP